MVSLSILIFLFFFQSNTHLSILNIVSKLLITMVCTFTIRELLKIEQEVIHGVKCANIEKSHS